MHKSGAQFLIVHGKNRLFAIQCDLQVRAFSGLEGCALIGKPSFEFDALHESKHKQ
jgi:hypothetical protein